MLLVSVSVVVLERCLPISPITLGRESHAEVPVTVVATVVAVVAVVDTAEPEESDPTVCEASSFVFARSRMLTTTGPCGGDGDFIGSSLPP